MPGFMRAPGLMTNNASFGPGFRRQGTPGRDFATAAGSIQAMSGRLIIATGEAAYEALQIIEDNIVKYVHPDSDHGFRFSEGRLAATIGTWKPELIKDPRVEERAIEWAQENGVDYEETDTGNSGEVTITENGAYKSVKRYRADTYAVEVGTFTPYAHLVEDGGEMEITIPGRNGRAGTQITAHWEAHNMFAKGIFDSVAELETMLAAKVKGIL
jgi:hypothetical protein